MRGIKAWILKGMFVVYVLPILLTTVLSMGCMSGEGTEGSGGCGQQQAQTRCGAGTKKVKDGNGYKCVPNTQ